MRVLVIDDQLDLRRIAALSLGPLGGMTVVVAEGGPQGLRLARDERPDVILLDVMMPDMDGPATLDALRRNPATATIPVIFLTGSSQPEEQAQLLALGAKGVLIKPFDPRSLASEVRALLEAG